MTNPASLSEAVLGAVTTLETMMAEETNKLRREGIRRSVETVQRSILGYLLSQPKAAEIAPQIASQPRPQASVSPDSERIVAAPPPQAQPVATKPSMPVPWKRAIQGGWAACDKLLESMAAAGQNEEAERFAELAVSALPPRSEDPSLPENQ